MTAAACLLASLLTGSSLAACSLETGGSGSAQSDLGDGNNPDNPDNPDPGTGTGTTADAGRPIVISDGAVVAPPTTTGACTAGHYEGTYECAYKQLGPFGGTSTAEVTGAVVFELVQKVTDASDTFTVAGGNFQANPVAFQTISAAMAGTLKCGHPFEGMLVKGMATTLLQLTPTQFQATVLATYDTKLSSFVQGTWSIPADANTGGCDGTWNAHLVPATTK